MDLSIHAQTSTVVELPTVNFCHGHETQSYRNCHFLPMPQSKIDCIVAIHKEWNAISYMAFLWHLWRLWELPRLWYRYQKHHHGTYRGCGIYIVLCSKIVIQLLTITILWYTWQCLSWSVWGGGSGIKASYLGSPVSSHPYTTHSRYLAVNSVVWNDKIHPLTRLF